MGNGTRSLSDRSGGTRSHWRASPGATGAQRPKAIDLVALAWQRSRSEGVGVCSTPEGDRSGGTPAGKCLMQPRRSAQRPKAIDLVAPSMRSSTWCSCVSLCSTPEGDRSGGTHGSECSRRRDHVLNARRRSIWWHRRLSHMQAQLDLCSTPEGDRSGGTPARAR